MQTRMLVRLGAVVFAALAVTTAALDLAHKDAPAQVAPTRVREVAPDPLRAALRRCQQLGQAAADDSACLRVWAESRDRFLGRAPTPEKVW